MRKSYGEGLMGHFGLVSRQLDVVATFYSVQLLSRQPGAVATSVPCSCCRDCFMMSRPQVFVIDVATTRCCRDFLSVELLSRQPGVVATSFLHYCCRDL